MRHDGAGLLYYIIFSAEQGVPSLRPGEIFKSMRRPDQDLTIMKLRFVLIPATILAVLTLHATAQTRTPPAQYDDRIIRDLSRPKYQPKTSGDRTIRDENEALRNRLLLPRDRQSVRGRRFID